MTTANPFINQPALQSTQVPQSEKFQLPFALPRYGNATERNRFFVHSAGQWLVPMRAHAYSVIEAAGAFPANVNTRTYNVEFFVRDGKHFLEVMRALGIVVTHMNPARGGYKCYGGGDMINSLCFVQTRTINGQISYTAVLPIREHAHLLFERAGLCQPVQVATQPQVNTDAFLASANEAMNEPTTLTEEQFSLLSQEEQWAYLDKMPDPALSDLVIEQSSDVVISEDQLPEGMR